MQEQLKELKVKLGDIISERWVQAKKNNDMEIIIWCGPTNCHRKGQGILMFDGSIKKVEDIIVGDQLMGPDSTPRNVLSLSRGIDDMVEIIPNKGKNWVVNKNHVLTLQKTCTIKKIKGKQYYSKTNELLDIEIQKYLDLSKSKKHLLKLVRTSIEFSKKNLPISPYYLGLLLGDGGLSNGSSNITTMDIKIVEEINNLAKDFNLKVVQRKQQKNNKSITYAISDIENNVGGKRNSLNNVLRKLNIYGKTSGDKFIPFDYKTSSREDRLELLAGLMDTYGSLDLLKTSFDYITKSKQLADDIAYIVRSVGLAAYPKKCKKSIKSIGFEGEYYRLSISGDTSIIPTRLERKKAEKRKRNYNVLHTGFKTKNLPKEIFYGFEIDGDHRYLLDDFTITHNSGKTFQAVQDLKQPGVVGCFNAPLRLLASEVYDKLNKEGVLCSLLTGEEKRLVRDSTITANTVEMVNYNKEYDVAIIDECQMIADPNRGSAWLSAILKLKAKKLHLIVAPNGLDLITKILDRLGRTYKINHLERFVPLKMSEKPNPLNKPVERAAYVVFSRAKVLELKQFFEDNNIEVSVVYGNLPPEVKRLQIEKFAEGRTKIVISTDAIGMGLNLPIDRVVFAEIEKFDGIKVRTLNATEVTQCGGRAGRRGLSDCGYVSALNKKSLEFIKERMSSDIPDLNKAMIAPEIDELELISEDRLVDKLNKWKELGSIPSNLKDLIAPIYLDEKIELAQKITKEWQSILGLEKSYLLTLAPVVDGIKEYWLECVEAICRGEFLPLPHTMESVDKKDDIDYLENCIKEHELYSWIGLRKPFEFFAPEMENVFGNKYTLIAMLDDALLAYNKLKNKCCINCGKEMQVGTKFSVCKECHNSGIDWSIED
jgi:hypothetical protein